MNKPSEQSEQASIKSDTSLSSSSSKNQYSLSSIFSSEAVTSDEAIYGDVSFAYVPVPENKPPSWNMARTPIPPKFAPATPGAPEINGIIFLPGLLLDAGLGAFLAFFANGNPLAWALIGAFAGLAITIFLYALLRGGTSELIGWSIFHHWPW